MCLGGFLSLRIIVSFIINYLGADNIPNDGIYSAYFLNYTGPGRYSAQVEMILFSLIRIDAHVLSQVFVKGNGNTTIDINGLLGVGSFANHGNNDSMVATGEFSRSTISRSFQVTSYEKGTALLYPFQVDNSS